MVLLRRIIRLIVLRGLHRYVLIALSMLFFVEFFIIFFLHFSFLELEKEEERWEGGGEYKTERGALLGFGDKQLFSD